jgi:hypothetical protein
MWCLSGRGCAYNQVASEDLQDLGLCTGPASKGLLQDVDKDVAERSADKGTVEGHLGHTRGEVVAILVAVLCDPRSEDFLGTRERARGDHLGTQRVGLELAQVCLDSSISCGRMAVAFTLNVQRGSRQHRHLWQRHCRPHWRGPACQ